MNHILNKKVLIIGCFDLYLHPYLEKYISVLDELGYEYKIVYWARNIDSLVEGEKFLPFKKRFDPDKKTLINKIAPYFAYKRFVMRILRAEKFDRIIFLASQTMFIFGAFARKKYKEKYIFDYRDVTYEKYPFYKNEIRKNIESSLATIVSSEGFKSIFPRALNGKFVFCHNAKNNFTEKKIMKTKSNVIRISFWGLIRQSDYFAKFLKVIGNDKRFVVNFYGTGDIDGVKKVIDDYCLTNIYLHGKFEQQDIESFAKETDLLLNCYSNDSIQKSALTVKMYEGFMFNIPMIVQKGSYMEYFLKENDCIFLPLDIDNGAFVSDDIYSFVCHLDQKSASISNNVMCSKIIEDQFNFINRLKELLEY